MREWSVCQMQTWWTCGQWDFFRKRSVFSRQPLPWQPVRNTNFLLHIENYSYLRVEQSYSEVHCSSLFNLLPKWAANTLTTNQHEGSAQAPDFWATRSQLSPLIPSRSKRSLAVRTKTFPRQERTQRFRWRICFLNFTKVTCGYVHSRYKCHEPEPTEPQRQISPARSPRCFVSRFSCHVRQVIDIVFTLSFCKLWQISANTPPGCIGTAMFLCCAADDTHLLPMQTPTFSWMAWQSSISFSHDTDGTWDTTVTTHRNLTFADGDRAQRTGRACLCTPPRQEFQWEWPVC